LAFAAEPAAIGLEPATRHLRCHIRGACLDRGRSASMATP
jgi:hypothetical protein